MNIVIIEKERDNKEEINSMNMSKSNKFNQTGGFNRKEPEQGSVKRRLNDMVNDNIIDENQEEEYNPFKKL